MKKHTLILSCAVCLMLPTMIGSVALNVAQYTRFFDTRPTAPVTKTVIAGMDLKDLNQ